MYVSLSLLDRDKMMRIKQTIVVVLSSGLAIAVTVWALFSTGFPQKHPIFTAGLCLYGCVITPVFILLGESIIEDVVKLVLMFIIAFALWKFQSWQVAIPFTIPPVCGTLANQSIKAMTTKKKSTNP